MRAEEREMDHRLTVSKSTIVVPRMNYRSPPVDQIPVWGVHIAGRLDAVHCSAYRDGPPYRGRDTLADGSVTVYEFLDGT